MFQNITPKVLRVCFVNFFFNTTGYSLIILFLDNRIRKLLITTDGKSLLTRGH